MYRKYDEENKSVGQTIRKINNILGWIAEGANIFGWTLMAVIRITAVGKLAESKKEAVLWIILIIISHLLGMTISAFLIWYGGLFTHGFAQMIDYEHDIAMTNRAIRDKDTKILGTLREGIKVEPKE